MKSTFIGKIRILLLFSLAAFLFLASPGVKAQAQENIANLAADDSANPPSRVARISFIEGSVSLQPGGTGDWGSATLNRPMTVGDKLWIDQNSRAEMQAGQISIHLAGMTALSFLNLDQDITQIRLAEGQINFRVRELQQGQVYEVDTPNLAFTVREAGAFRINVSENGDHTSVVAIRGQGEIAAAGQTYTVHPGQQATFTGTGDNLKFVAGTAPEPDALDRWSQERDLKEENSLSAQHVSREVVGYSDLDDYGTWREEPNYGSVWVPSAVPAGWAPYSSGYWNWVGPWGWTWVDYAPWGFAPFHYGRWNYFGNYWGWYPGPIYARPYYGPAFVGFLGGFGVGVGFGWGWGRGIGWFPLGWGEPFRPWYRCGAGYWRNVNVSNTHIRNINVVNGGRNFNYAYAHNVNAVTTTSRTGFVSGQSVNRGAARLTEASLRGAHVSNGANVSPTHASYFGASSIHGRVATPSSNVQNRSVMARTAPAAAASHSPVHTINNATLSAGHFGNKPLSSTTRTTGAPQGVNANRQSQLSANRPSSAMAQGSRPPSSVNSAGRPGTSARTWNAQGNVTDSGRAPQGFGRGNQPPKSLQSTHMNSSDRPPWARGNSAGNYAGTAQRNSVNRPTASPNVNRSSRPPSYNTNRGYSAPRSYNSPAPRGYSAAPSYSAPRGYSAPHSYSAPSGSGGGFRGGSSGSVHGGGGGFHGGGGSHGGHR
jgi:hypothetical protein